MEFYTYTNPGMREINEDSCGVSQYGNTYCFVVADGLGGHGKGEVASSLAVEKVCELFMEKGFSKKFFDEAFKCVQQTILQKQYESRSMAQMKTTLVILVVHDGKADWAYIGDSRLYCFKNGCKKLRSLDHSVPQMLVMTGDIKESEIRHHPDRNRLMRVLGVQGEEPRYEVGENVKINGNMAFLLCTDGYWELIEDSDMETLLRTSESPEEWIKAMNLRIEQNGKGIDMDNYTSIAVWVKKKGLFGR